MAVTYEDFHPAGKILQNKHVLDNIIKGTINSDPRCANRSNEGKNGSFALPGTNTCVRALTTSDWLIRSGKGPECSSVEGVAQCL